MNMNAEILTGTEISAGRRKPSEIVAEYEMKRGELSTSLAEFEAAGVALDRAATIGGTFGNVTIDTGRVYESTLEQSLLCSAWRYVYNYYDLPNIASAEDKRRFEQMFAAPPEFTVENIREHFGDLFYDPWGSVLRGLAEVFCDLDPAFKSHEKMKIGVKGLPKRVILSGVTDYGSWGRDRLQNILNALAAYQGKPLVTHLEMTVLIEKDGEALRDGGEVMDPFESRQYTRAKARGDDLAVEPPTRTIPARGVWLKRYQNGNGHLYFGPEALRDVNRGLAEYYGEVLPDCPEARPSRQRTGTDVTKDLQYYPTPIAVVDRVVADLCGLKDRRVLEPSCGCGRFMDALRKAGAEVIGCEIDPGRAAICEAKGHRVIRMNFLETVPTGDFDKVVMNPPFYGRTYAKHLRHALKFLKPGGILTAILPISARYDHGELDAFNPRWSDLPVGSFSESGTNINTTVATIRRPA